MDEARKIIAQAAASVDPPINQLHANEDEAQWDYRLRQADAILAALATANLNVARKGEHKQGEPFDPQRHWIDPEKTGSYVVQFIINDGERTLAAWQQYNFHAAQPQEGSTR